MKVLEQLVPLGHPNRPGTKLNSVRALVFHYTANENMGANDTATAKYFGRKYVKVGDKFYEADGKTEFSYGSAQVIADMDSVTIAIPVDEAAWAVGDRRVLPWTEQWRGQQHMSRNVFDCQPNYRSISIEICDNDVVKNSKTDWDGAVANAVQWAIDYCKQKNLKIDLAGSLDPQNAKPPVAGKILICRHRDISGKICPKPFIDDQNAWVATIQKIANAVGV